MSVTRDSLCERAGSTPVVFAEKVPSVATGGGGARVSIADISDERLGGSRPPERTPPHDLLAEQSALGGMMLSKDAVADVIETLKGADFYVPKHELIFEAILSLYSHGEPTDVVAVTADFHELLLKDLRKHETVARDGYLLRH